KNVLLLHRLERLVSAQIRLMHARADPGVTSRLLQIFGIGDRRGKERDGPPFLIQPLEESCPKFENPFLVLAENVALGWAEIDSNPLSLKLGRYLRQGTPYGAIADHVNLFLEAPALQVRL